MKYKQIKIGNFNNVYALIESTERENNYEFVGFFYESDVYGLFNTYLLFKEKRQ